MSQMGVPSIRSAPATTSTGPSVPCSTRSSSTQDRPMGLGRKGERVANTPTRRLPPSRGGRTVGDQPSRAAAEKAQMSHRWEKSSSPRTASALRNSGAKTTRPSSPGTSPGCRGMPNLEGKSVRIWAMGIMVTASMGIPPDGGRDHLPTQKRAKMRPVMSSRRERPVSWPSASMASSTSVRAASGDRPERSASAPRRTASPARRAPSA